MTDSRPRTILVTGSGSGIGAAIVSRLAKPGTALMIHAKQNKNGCERVVGRCARPGCESGAHACRS